MIIFLIRCDLEEFGVDWGSPITESGVDSEIHVPSTQLPVDESSHDMLKELIDPLQPCSDYGIDFFNASVQFIQSIT